MNQDLTHAKMLLEQGGLTCVLCKGDSVHTSTTRGIRPLVEFLDAGSFTGYSAADKVVGKATAFLYVLLGVRAVYTPVVSTAAIDILRSHRIELHYLRQTDVILNRTRTGFCPMENAVRDLEDPGAALDAVRRTLAQLR